VAIILGPQATSDWKEAGSRVLEAGPRIVGIWTKTGRVSMAVVSAYAPLSTATEEEREEFLEATHTCMRRLGNASIQVMGVDLNASLGASEKYAKEEQPMHAFKSTPMTWMLALPSLRMHVCVASRNSSLSSSVAVDSGAYAETTAIETRPVLVQMPTILGPASSTRLPASFQSLVACGPRIIATPLLPRLQDRCLSPIWIIVQPLNVF
jgi:hypothetical protein